MNTVAKGNRQASKTIKWLEGQGYIATKCEYRTKYQTYDLWGADVIARNESDIVLAQVKGNKGHMAEGVRQLSKDSKWPKWVRRLVVHWPLRAREPVVREVT